MSTLNVSNISDGTDTVETGYVVNGSAKAFERHTASHTIVSSLNVSGLTDNGTGDTSVSYTNAFAAADQIIVGSVGSESNSSTLVSSIQKEASLSTSHRYKTTNASFTSVNAPVNCTIALGDLA